MKTTNNVINYERLLKHYNLKNLVRYNHRVRAKDESVAEHSYFVTLFTRMICTELNDKSDSKVVLTDAMINKAMSFALIHDLPEIYMSDIPHPVKASNPMLYEILENLEESIVQNEYPEYYELYKAMTAGSSDSDKIVSKIVKLADILSVIQYASLEVRLGNKGAIDIIDDSVSRYLHCKAELKELTGVSVSYFETETTI